MYLVYLLYIIISITVSGEHLCGTRRECGWYADCVNGSCICEPGFSRTNSVDCRNDNCTDKSCLHCHSPELCVRCSNFLEETSQTCISSCQGLYHISQQGEMLGRICPDFTHFHANRVHFTEVVSIGCAVAIPVVMLILMCLRARMVGRLALIVDDLGDDDLKLSRKRFLDPVFENYIEPFYSENSVAPGGRVHFTQLVCDLKSQLDDLTNMLKELTKARDNETERDDIQAYDNIISHLWRVITILNKFNPIHTMPSDGCELLLWAKQLLEKYLEHQREMMIQKQQLPIQYQSCLVMGYMANDDDYTFHVSYV